MPRGWVRNASTRNLLTGFLLVTGVPVAALVWLGFQLVDQDRQLAAQREAERRELAAGRVISAMDQMLAAEESNLGIEAPPQPGAVRALVSSTLRVFPADAIAYAPSLPALPEAPPGTFDRAEEAEFRRGDSSQSVEILAGLADSPNPSIRAGALLRLARNLRKLGKTEDMLRAYQQMTLITNAGVEGIPADLAARRARAIVLAELGRPSELEALKSEVKRGRWQLDRATYILYADQPPPPSRAALSEAVGWLATNQNRLPDRGRRLLTLEQQPVLLLWRKSARGLEALAALPSYLNVEWFSRLPAVEATVAVTSPSGEALWGTNTAGTAKTTRNAADTGLPWNVIITSRPGVETPLGSRRGLLAAGLLALVFLLAAGTYFIVRALLREVAVMRLQSDFVAAVSHEFRTPLTSMRQFNELLLQDNEPPPEKRRVFYQAQTRATDRLHRLVESLLDFGRMEAGRHPYQLQALDAAELAESVVADFRREIAPRGFAVDWKSNGPAPVRADPDALSRALWNLLDNAAKYSGESRWIGVELETHNRAALIHVRDLGIGVPAAERERIFDKFMRGAQAGKDGIKGTGIGLAMVRHIVEAHRGQITVDSEPGRGTTFTISIPRQE